MGSDRTPIDVRLQRLSTIDGATGCWVWNGYRMRLGYGRVALDGKAVSAHRASYMTFRGPIPKGAFVCHTCDNRACINPDHLYLGNHATNMRDMTARQRHPGGGQRGEEHYAAKLTERDVREMRASGQHYADAAKKYGITKGYAWSVINGYTWRNVA